MDMLRHEAAERHEERILVNLPCGHQEPFRALTLRIRRTSQAAWVTCRVCNLTGMIRVTTDGAKDPG
jgi:hypothetical protein